MNTQTLNEAGITKLLKQVTSDLTSLREMWEIISKGSVDSEIGYAMMRIRGEISKNIELYTTTILTSLQAIESDHVDKPVEKTEWN